MAVNVKMGVDLGQFTSGIRQGQTILKGLNAEMKAADAAFKATGNAEQQLASKTKTLTSQLNVQKSIADQAAKALKAMADSGVKPTDQAYQKMYATMMNAQAGMNEAQAALNALDGSQQQAAASANDLSDSVGKIGKKLSLDQVIGGIKSITDAMENAGRAAVHAGEAIWDNIMQSAEWGDDVATQASMFQMSVEEYQRVVNVAKTAGETSPNELLKGWKTLKKNLVSDSAEVQKAFEQIGISRTEAFELEGGTPRWMQGMDLGTAKNWEDIFWDIGDALMAMGDSEQQEAIARTLLGRSWQDLIPMFELGKDRYNELKESTDVNGDGTISNLSALADKVHEVEQRFETLKNEVIGAIAPAFTEAADTISQLLHNLNEYLKTDEGQKMLQTMGETVRGLFEDLGKVDPKELVNNFTSVFTSLTDGMKWIVQNKDTLVNALKAVVAGWAGLKLTGGALSILKIINGLQDLGIVGGGAAAAKTAGSAIGGSLLNMTASGLTNGAFVADWALNNTTGGQILTGKKTVEEARKEFEQWQTDTVNRVGSFFDDWAHIGDPNWDFENHRQITRQAQEVLGGGGSAMDLDPLTRMKMHSEDAQKMIEELGEPEITLKPMVPDGASAQISTDIGTVQVPVELVVTNPGAVRPSVGGGGGAGTVVAMQYANGLPYVPYDNYLALLHKGEKVVPARATGNNFSSNLYVDRMIMNNGQDAQGLAGAVAAANRRIMRGYGS